jgi:hypothetical protein
MSTPSRPVASPLQVLANDHIASATARNKFRLACPRRAHREELAERALVDAVALVGLVRDEDPRVVHGALAYYTHEQLAVLCVALAAMVPPDRSTADLLAWLDTPATEVA